MNREERKKYLRFIYALTFRLFGICLVICAMVGGIYGSTMYAVWAMCAAGSIVICWGWFLYLQLNGMRLFGFKPKSQQPAVPYIHRRFKQKRPHRPAFQKDAADFDDDLTAATVVDAENFSEEAVKTARIWSKVAAGILLYLVSFFI